MWTLNYLPFALSIYFSLTAAEPTQTDFLSPRAGRAIELNQGWKKLNDSVLSKPYDPNRYPHGIINLGLAENWLIQKELSEYLMHNFTIDPLYHLTYGQGAAASPHLRKSLAKFINNYFHPYKNVSEYEIIVASGVTSLIDSIAWNTCSDNESIIIPQPLYNGFPTDIRLRSETKLLNASFLWDNHNYTLDDVFDPVMIRKSLDRAWNEKNGTVRGIVIANPHNPLGRCYSEEALKEIAHFCGEHKIHFISDEIYANSVFDNDKVSDPTLFTSVLSLNLTDIIDENLVHVMYGMSKDFGASGLRLGVLHSRNKNMTQAAYGVNLFSWPSYLAQDMWARLLDDETATHNFLNKNSARLADAYRNVTAWLEDKNIMYYQGGNAGLFVWAKLLPNLTSITPGQLVDACRAHGVNIGDGQNFLPEVTETGWFRITFSYPPDMLWLGLQRLEKTLKKLGIITA
ncbi:hypothetical protein EYZ11_010669 [Aspergillus tanneri]|uniref:Aminotransferase class I/classII large domain-containing protein n=1 Tax=Aspergillus tanneri TaxID=1220188 RepID=A0A4S3JA61_9EURO|nr:uncharacterized protein ATNIH1004_009218 [Aspergillus tanneri]KAA8645007.1 hypothetical protein ATNIH1004_009218 [Aspergillus tanneri]THC89881.1 hypothetical protein EYZ11_010669 [Aspergillus tanneri]